MSLVIYCLGACTRIHSRMKVISRNQHMPGLKIENLMVSIGMEGTHYSNKKGNKEYDTGTSKRKRFWQEIANPSIKT